MQLMVICTLLQVFTLAGQMDASLTLGNYHTLQAAQVFPFLIPKYVTFPHCFGFARSPAIKDHAQQPTFVTCLSPSPASRRLGNVVNCQCITVPGKKYLLRHKKGLCKLSPRASILRGMVCGNWSCDDDGMRHECALHLGLHRGGSLLFVVPAFFLGNKMCAHVC